MSFNFPGTQRKSSGFAVASLVLGILCLVFFWFPYLNLLLAGLATTFGGIGLSAVKKGTGDSKGLAVAGLVMGIIGLVAAVAVLILVWTSNDTGGGMGGYLGG